MGAEKASKLEKKASMIILPITITSSETESDDSNFFYLRNRGKYSICTKTIASGETDTNDMFMVE